MLGIALTFLLPEGLSFEARCVLAILAWAIIWWIFNVLPEYVTALIMAILFIAVAGVPATTMFSTFSTPIWWLLLGAFGLGVGMQQSGLMRRIALFLLNLFPHSYSGQTLGLMLSGTVAGPLIPSLSAKAAILSPLAIEIATSQGYSNKSPQMEGLFLASFIGIRNAAPAIINASVIGFALLALYPDNVAAQFSLGYWFFCALPWFLCVSILNFAAITLIFKPKDRTRIRSLRKTRTSEPWQKTRKQCWSSFFSRSYSGFPSLSMVSLLLLSPSERCARPSV